MTATRLANGNPLYMARALGLKPNRVRWQIRLRSIQAGDKVSVPPVSQRRTMLRLATAPNKLFVSWQSLGCHDE